jgi:hypothetical protein
MTPGDLVSAVSIAMDVPRETVFQHDRNLVVAGLRTFGGRGRNAPTVTPLDAARLMIAVLGSARVLDSVETVKAFTEATFHPLAGSPVFDPAIASLPPNHNFIEALAALINDASAPFHADHPHQFLRRFAEMMIVCETRPTEGAIRHPRGGSAEYKTAEQSIAERNKYDPGVFDYEPSYEQQYGIFQVRSTRGAAIVLLGRAFRENGLAFETTGQAIGDLMDATTGKPKKRNAKDRAGAKSRAASS